MSSRRAHRVGEQMKKEISALIQRGIKDPRVGMATITEVRLSDDLRYARVYVTALGEKPTESKTLEALHNATGFIRREIGKRVRLRYIPEITFVWDDAVEKGARIQQLLEEIRRTEAEKGKEEHPSSEVSNERSQ